MEGEVTDGLPEQDGTWGEWQPVAVLVAVDSQEVASQEVAAVSAVAAVAEAGRCRRYKLLSR